MCLFCLHLPFALADLREGAEPGKLNLVFRRQVHKGHDACLRSGAQCISVQMPIVQDRLVRCFHYNFCEMRLHSVVLSILDLNSEISVLPPNCWD